MKTILFLILIASPNAFSQVWSYLGIPYTDWSYDPFTLSYQRPPQWDTSSTSAVTNKYYIAPDHPSATDTNNPYGHPDLPRKNFPVSGWIGDSFPAGTVFFMAGNFSSTNFKNVTGYNPTLNGTETEPIFFVGDPSNPPKFSDVRFTLIDSKHVVFDGLHWTGGNLANQVLSMARGDRSFDSHHITVKNCRFENLSHISGGAGIIGVTGPNNNWVHDVVAYRNVFKGCGRDANWYTTDADHHGVHPGQRAYRVWIIENDVQLGDAPDPIDGVRKGISGNLIQVGGNTNVATDLHHIYGAGNTALNGGMRQGLCWTKNSHKVIFSQNYCNRANQTFFADNGQCFGSQYNASHHWFIFNVSENSLAGWMHTDNGGKRLGPHIIYGNVFKNLNSGNLNATNSFDRSAISIWNNQNDHYIVNNTMYNCESSVSILFDIPSDVTMTIKNNLASLQQGLEQRFLTTGTASGALNIDNNIFHSVGTWSARVAGTTHTSVASLNAGSYGIANIQSNPLLVSAPAILSISANSPAKDAGTMSTDIPSLFAATFANDSDYPGTPNIAFTIDGADRIQGPAIDIGAYELGTPGDNDNDGIPDEIDPDDDNDDLPDEVEISLSLNPLANDSDGNGTLDGDEDTDRDGQTNASEVLLVLTDPGDANSFFKASISVINGDVSLKFQSLSGRHYQVQTSTNLNAWTPLLAEPLAPTFDGLIVYDLGRSDETCFYRIQVSLAP